MQICCGFCYKCIGKNWITEYVADLIAFGSDFFFLKFNFN